jgi:hypothetical protein
MPPSLNIPIIAKKMSIAYDVAIMAHSGENIFFLQLRYETC